VIETIKETMDQVAQIELENEAVNVTSVIEALNTTLGQNSSENF
jgi:hypothetical protein